MNPLRSEERRLVRRISRLANRIPPHPKGGSRTTTGRLITKHPGLGDDLSPSYAKTLTDDDRATITALRRTYHQLGLTRGEMRRAGMRVVAEGEA